MSSINYKAFLDGPHSKQWTAVNKYQQHQEIPKKILGTLRIKPGRGARMLSTVICGMWPPILCSVVLIFQIGFQKIYSYRILISVMNDTIKEIEINSEMIFI